MHDSWKPVIAESGNRMAAGERKGQAAFNAVYLHKPDLANQIRGTDIDPFYDDSRLPAFWAKVAELDG